MNLIDLLISKFFEWSARWRVCFNASKTVYMYMVITNRITGVEYPDLHLNGTKITKVL